MSERSLPSPQLVEFANDMHMWHTLPQFERMIVFFDDPTDREAMAMRAEIWCRARDAGISVGTLAIEPRNPNLLSPLLNLAENGEMVHSVMFQPRMNATDAWNEVLKIWS